MTFTLLNQNLLNDLDAVYVTPITRYYYDFSTLLSPLLSPIDAFPCHLVFPLFVLLFCPPPLSFPSPIPLLFPPPFSLFFPMLILRVGAFICLLL